MKGTAKPDYGQSVDIATKAALREMVAPGLLVVLLPIAVGLAFRLLYYGVGRNLLGVHAANGAEVV